MPRSIHVIPVGRSMLDYVEREETDGLHGALNLADAAVGAETRTRLLAATDSATGLVSIDALAVGIRRGTRELRNTPHACAEWTSVHAEGRLHNDAATDRSFVLLASDTDEGLNAAVYVAARYSHAGQVHYIDGEQGAALDRLQPGAVYVCRIPGLNLAKDLPYRTWIQLGRIGHVVADSVVQAHGRGDDGRVVFHLNGGYKAMLPFVLVLAEGTKTVVTEKTSWPVYALVLHESSVFGSTNPADWRIADIPIPTLTGLREDARHLADQTEELRRDYTGTQREPLRIPPGRWDYGYLEGQFFVRNGRDRELTPTGLILLEML